MAGKIRFTLAQTLEELEVSRNKLAVKSEIRPATIGDMVNEETKRIELDTLISILDTLNMFAREKGYRPITIDDVFVYEHEETEQ